MHQRRFEAERHGEMRLADAGQPEQEDIVAAVEIASGGQIANHPELHGGVAAAGLSVLTPRRAHSNPPCNRYSHRRPISLDS